MLTEFRPVSESTWDVVIESEDTVARVRRTESLHPSVETFRALSEIEMSSILVFLSSLRRDQRDERRKAKEAKQAPAQKDIAWLEDLYRLESDTPGQTGRVQ